MKKSKSQMQKVIGHITNVIEKGNKTRKQIIVSCEKRFPELATSTFATLLSDGKNKKYNKFVKLIKEGDDKVLSF